MRRLGLILAVAGPWALGPGPRTADPVPGTGSSAFDIASRDSAIHLLNRAAFGPRPGDIERVLAMGIDAWIEQQLHPGRLPDPAVAARLRPLAALAAPTTSLHAAYQAEVRARRRRQQARSQDDSAGMGRREPSLVGRHVWELQHATAARAVVSERQLLEVLTDFWVNHFNVYLRKGPNRVLIRDYVDETIRPRVLGSFADLLIATAQSPAMLIYLDNARSVAEGAEPPQVTRRARMRAAERSPTQRARLDSARARLDARRPTGPNENYARELLELHTLGVDGGYTQADVEAVARMLTGWGLRRPGGGPPTFGFMAWAHDSAPKRVMGREFAGGVGVEEGLDLLRWLANHPATRRHVSGKLCARFVADSPPADCVDAAVEAWETTDGDLRAVVRAILHSGSFWAPDYRDAKTKTPLEFLVSALRAVGSLPDSLPGLARTLGRLDQPPYVASAPTGYGEREERWVGAAAMLDRFTVALAIGAGRLSGAVIDLDRVVPLTEDRGAIVQAVHRVVLQGRASEATLTVLHQQARAAGSAQAARARVIGLALGSPEFQRQ